MQYLNKKRAFILIFLMCYGSVGYALYAEYYQSMIPCPLCIAERVILIVTGTLALIFALHNPRNFLSRIYGIIIAICAISGLKITAHHIWLINLPADQQPLSCGMPLAVVYNKLPLTGFLKYILAGDAECTKVNWTIFNISVPTVLIVWFTLILILSGYIIFTKSRNKRNTFFIQD